MENIEAGSESGGRQGDRRQTDRRGGQRRREDRRAPPPPWRSPAAYVAYGVVGAFALVMLVRGMQGDSGDPGATAAMVEPTAAPERVIPPESPTGAVRDAHTIAQFEALLAEGNGAVGQVVRTELYCGSITPITVRTGEAADPRLAPMTDGEGRVGAAECRWSSEARSSDFLLVVPPHLAEEFARSPEVELNFVRRRRIPANVEWLGRSDALSLRTSGVLRTIER